MKTLNVVLTVTLIIVTLFYFIDTKRASNRINGYNSQLHINDLNIKLFQTTIEKLNDSNYTLTTQIDSLRAVSLSLQGKLLLYRDSVDNLHDNFNLIYDEVTNLSDIDSYEYFLKYVRDYDRRYK